jgi:EAL domain-containing protein (putative c-di-GMP-specific phosphodiesterase class I)
MNATSVFARIHREADGTYTTSYGPFVLQTALQPIFGEDASGALELAAFEGLVRANRNGDPFPPAQFFPLVDRADLPTIDSLCRTLHILNAGHLHRRNAKLFVNFHPGMFLTLSAIKQEVERISIATHESGMRPEQIVCEISRKDNEDLKAITHFADSLRELGFKIAVDEYGAQDSDAERVNILKADFVKLETTWVHEFMQNSAGFALLKVMVDQFMSRGIQPIFEGLEELSQVELCQQLGVPLMQGYFLARPEIAPTTFNQTFPEPFEPVRAQAPAFSRTPSSEARGTRRNASFGRRGV